MISEVEGLDYHFGAMLKMVLSFCWLDSIFRFVFHINLRLCLVDYLGQGLLSHFYRLRFYFNIFLLWLFYCSDWLIWCGFWCWSLWLI